MRRMFFREVDLEYLIENHYDLKLTGQYCQQCPRYGKSWCCPPFEADNGYDYIDRIRRYDKALLFALRITPNSISEVLTDEVIKNHIAAEKQNLHKWLIPFEKMKDGLALTFTGQCSCCVDLKCSREEGKQCRNPEMCRPSLESVGFNVCSIAEDILNLPLSWKVDSKTAPNLTLVGALLH